VTRKHKETMLVVLSGFLWLATTGLAWAGLWFPALFVLLALIATYATLAVTHNGRTDIRLLLFPILPWIALWAATFALAEYHANAFAGGPPDFAIFGLHPSFAWIVLAYWLGGALVMTLGYYWKRDIWLTNERWEEFVRSVHAVEPEKGE